jgi:hypothetical protein
MGSTAATPTRVNKDVYAAAKVAASLTGRTVAEQLSHWAKVGSEVEAIALLELRRRRRTAQDLLAGRDYDSLPADEQALVRTTWDEEMDERLVSTGIAADKRTAGQPFITLDDDGNVVRHLPDGTVEQR